MASALALGARWGRVVLGVGGGEGACLLSELGSGEAGLGSESSLRSAMGHLGVGGWGPAVFSPGARPRRPRAPRRPGPGGAVTGQIVRTPLNSEKPAELRGSAGCCVNTFLVAPSRRWVSAGHAVCKKPGKVEEKVECFRARPGFDSVLLLLNRLWNLELRRPAKPQFPSYELEAGRPLLRGWW